MLDQKSKLGGISHKNYFTPLISRFAEKKGRKQIHNDFEIDIQHFSIRNLKIHF